MPTFNTSVHWFHHSASSQAYLYYIYCDLISFRWPTLNSDLICINIQIIHCFVLLYPCIAQQQIQIRLNAYLACVRKCRPTFICSGIALMIYMDSIYITPRLSFLETLNAHAFHLQLANNIQIGIFYILLIETMLVTTENPGSLQSEIRQIPADVRSLFGFKRTNILKLKYECGYAE